MRRCGLQRRADARGAATVEFALILIPLMLIVFGIISYGYMLSFRQAISQAAAEGARAAAVAQNSADRVGDATKSLDEALGSYKMDCAGGALKKGSTTVGTCTVSSAEPCTNDATKDCVKVTISYNYKDHPLMPAPGIGLVLPDELEYSAVARVS